METLKGPTQTTGPLKWGYMGFHVSLGECLWLHVHLGSSSEKAIESNGWQLFTRLSTPKPTEGLF